MKRLKIVYIALAFLMVGCGYSSENAEKITDYKIDENNSISNDLNSDEIDCYHYCYYDVLQNGDYVTNPEWKKSNAILTNVALLVIDPWNDSPFEELNASIQKNVDDYIIPIIDSVADDDNISVLIFTNDPSTISYDTQITDSLQNIVDSKKAELHYYNEFSDADDFAEYMRKRGFDTLVYTGYAIEMCVGYRNCGVVQNYCSDYGYLFNRYIIPECCLAVYTENEKENDTMKYMTITAYSQQNVADVIYFNDWIHTYNN